MATEKFSPDCPLTAALLVLGGKWKIFVLSHLSQHDTLRFGQLHRLIPQVTQKMLTQQLRELEEAGLVTRQIYAEVPPRVEYRLTPHGDTIRPIIVGLYAWGKTHRHFLGEPDVPSLCVVDKVVEQMTIEEASIATSQLVSEAV